jgi:hypothetical protein
MLAVAESRHQGLFLKDEIEKSEVKIGNFMDEKIANVIKTMQQD